MKAKIIVGIVVGLALVLPALAQNLGLFRTANDVAVTVVSDQSLEATQINSRRPLSDGLPSRGMSMQQVEKRHGAPVSRRTPVGDPPITRWEYDEFIVYFEYRHVIHSVPRK